jgi:hypothetical protein
MGWIIHGLLLMIFFCGRIEILNLQKNFQKINLMVLNKKIYKQRFVKKPFRVINCFDALYTNYFDSLFMGWIIHGLLLTNRHTPSRVNAFYIFLFSHFVELL